MKKKALFFATACILGTMASLFSVNSTSAKAEPICSYVGCPGGSQNCCSEGGVTLYNNPK